MYSQSRSDEVLTDNSDSAITVEKLLVTDKSWDGAPYHHYPKGIPLLTVLRISIAPYSLIPWHTHPMPCAGYVLSGALIVEKKEGVRYEVKAGQAIAEMVDAVHRGFTEAEGTSLIVFCAGAHDLPLSVLSKED